MLFKFRGFPIRFRDVVRSCFCAGLVSASMALGALQTFADTPRSFERWERVVAADGERFAGVVYGNGRTLASGDNAWHVSADGKTWERIDPPLRQHNVTVEFVGGNFVAHGNGAIAFSVNGVDWVQSNPLGRVVAIAGGHDSWVVVDSNGRLSVGRRAGDEEKVQWRSPANGPGQVNAAAAFGNGRFLAVSGREVFLSEDGMDWRSAGDCGIEPGRLVFSAGRFFAAGMDEEGYPQVISSADGGSWTRAPLALGNRVPELLISDFGAHVGAGDRLYSSADGRNWREDRFVAENDPAKPYYGKVPRRWPPVTVHGVAADGGRIVALASGRQESRFPMRANQDVNPVEGLQVIDLRSGVVRQTMVDLPFLPSGIGRTNTGFILTAAEGALMVSKDAGEWEFVFPYKISWNGIAGNANRAVAVGSGGWIAGTEDGRTWNAEQSPVEATLRAVATDGERFVAVGDWGTVLVSEDGLSWTMIESPAREHLREVVFHQGRFVLLGAATIMHSTDGWNWRRAGVMRGGFRTGSMAAFGGRLVMSDSFRENTQSILISEDGMEWKREEYLADEALSWIAGTAEGWIALGLLNPEDNPIFRTDGGRRFARSEKRLPWISRSVEVGDALIAAGQGVHALNGGSWREIASHHARDVAYFRDRLWTVGGGGLFRSLPARASGELSPEIRAVRAWQSVDGRALEGELVSADFSSATIRRSADEREVRVPLSRLAPEDRKRLEEELETVLSSDHEEKGKTTGSLAMPGTWKRPDLPAAHRLRFTWEPLMDAFEHDFTGLAGDGAVVVAVGKGGLFLVSRDHGTSWNGIRESPDADWIGVERIGGRFVAWASHAIAVSDDGREWTFSPIDRRVTSVAGNDGLLCAVGARGFAAVSRDGREWATAEAVTMSDLNRVVSMNDRFVAISHNAVFHSRNGRDWTEASVGEGNHPQGVFVAGNRFFMTKRGGSELSVAVSGNGADWETVRLPGEGAVSNARSVNGVFAIQQSSNTLLLTADGKDWETMVFDPPGFTLAGARIEAMHSIDGTYLIATERGRLARGDGRGEWNEISPGPPAVLEAFHYTGERYLAAGRYGTLLTSEKGREWKPVRGLPVAWSGVAAMGNRLVVAGAGGTVAYSDQAIPGGSAVAFIGTNLEGENDLLALGSVSDGLLVVGSNGFIAQSGDGQRWTPIAAEMGVDLTGLAFSGDDALVVGAHRAAILQRRGSRWTVANEVRPNAMNVQATFVRESPHPQWSVPYYFDGHFFRMAQTSGGGNPTEAPPVMIWNGSQSKLRTGTAASWTEEPEVSVSGKIVRTFAAADRVFGIGSLSISALLASQQLYVLQDDGIWRETPVMLPPGTVDVAVAENRLFAVGKGGRVHRSRFMIDAGQSSSDRTWTDREGREIVASLMEAGQDTIRLRRRDGQEFAIPMSRLSANDRRHIQFMKASMFTAP